MSWIVSPFKDGVVIAFEIHSASAVAGPFHGISDQTLDRLMREATTPGQPPPTVH
jgi:hypothetical protein